MNFAAELKRGPILDRRRILIAIAGAIGSGAGIASVWQLSGIKRELARMREKPIGDSRTVLKHPKTYLHYTEVGDWKLTLDPEHESFTLTVVEAVPHTVGDVSTMVAGGTYISQGDWSGTEAHADVLSVSSPIDDLRDIGFTISVGTWYALLVADSYVFSFVSSAPSAESLSVVGVWQSSSGRRLVISGDGTAELSQGETKIETKWCFDGTALYLMSYRNDCVFRIDGKRLVYDNEVFERTE